VTVPVDLLAHYRSGATTLAWAIKIVRRDGVVYGWTSSTKDATISGVDYRSAPGLDVASLATTAGLAVDNTEITILPDQTVITHADIIAGRWDNAQYTLFRYNWSDLTDGIEVRAVGRLGELQPRSGAYVAELRGLQQYLQQTIGTASTKTCRARLGDDLCSNYGADLDITDAAYTKTGTLTSVTSKQIFRDSSRVEAEDFFGEGVFTFTGGDNAGLSQKVKAYAVNGTFTLSLPMIMTVAIGDTYSVHAGCRKRIDEDCITKFNNVLNFQGEPHRPTVDDVTSAPDAGAV
jgi:uncharacterized phage protein (TIGR02218 family)